MRMFKEAYKSVNKKIEIKPEIIEHTKGKVMRQLKKDSSKPRYFLRYGIAAASLCIVTSFVLLSKAYLMPKLQKNNPTKPPVTQNDEKKVEVDISKLNPELKKVLDEEYITVLKLEMINDTNPVMYVDFTYHYDLDTAGVPQIENIMEKLAKANNYISFQIIDESKALNLKVECDKDTKKINDIYVNGNKNLFKEIKDYGNEISNKRELAMEYLKQQVPEINAFEEQIKSKSNGKSSLEMRVLISPDKYSNRVNKDYYQIYVAENSSKLSVKWNIFYVNEELNKIMVEDFSTENMISLEQWREGKGEDKGGYNNAVDDRENQFFFDNVEGEKHYTYKGQYWNQFLKEEDIPEDLNKDDEYNVTADLKVTELAKLRKGKVYELRFSIYGDKNKTKFEDEVIYLWVTGDKIYEFLIPNNIDASMFQDDDGSDIAGVAKAFEEMGILPSDDEAMLRASNSSMKIPSDNEQIEKEIEVKNDTCKYTYSHTGSSHYIEFNWKVGKGITFYEKSYGAHRDGVRLTLVE